MKKFLVGLFVILSVGLRANTDSVFIRSIYNEALASGECYENLRSLCKDVGARVTGSAEAKMAIKWGFDLLSSYGFDNVYLQEIKVPHWERGNTEAGWILNEQGDFSKLNILALGGSVGTDGLMEGEVILVESVTDLENFTKDQIKGKIVFFNKPFDQTQISTFKAYGACIDQRWDGATKASLLEAKAVIIRSLAQSTDEHAHTGSMHYEEGVVQIPAAAISTVDADRLTEWLKNGKVFLRMEMDCRFFPDEISYNVIAEMTGHEDDKIITFGGHLDSWDTGEGAHDDGAGIVHCIEAIRILHKLKYYNNHTLRCVLFMNEENGNFGGKYYAELASENKEEHICAIESDRGGFLPIGFDIQGTTEQVAMVQEFKDVLYDFELYRFEPGYSGVDIRPLLQHYPGMVQLGMVINSQEYFDYHHAETDVFESVNKRELELGSAAMATMIYLMDKYL
ncbi:MAG: M28 family peptidase [Crocinitomicaceae bacterium]|nr:M28 family peptidase [Crocinitomicaceae bacterium]MBK8925172.1 M28 family peptidase [Crocinitomicaceae bacterium]